MSVCLCPCLSQSLLLSLPPSLSPSLLLSLPLPLSLSLSLSFPCPKTMLAFKMRGFPVVFRLTCYGENISSDICLFLRRGGGGRWIKHFFFSFFTALNVSWLKILSPFLICQTRVWESSALCLWITSTSASQTFVTARCTSGAWPSCTAPSSTPTCTGFGRLCPAARTSQLLPQAQG